MKYWPYSKYEIRSEKSINEIVDNLNALTKRKRLRNIFLNRDPNVGEFEGVIKSNSFKINRIIKGRNSFLPRIHGRIERNNHFVIVYVAIKMNVIVEFTMIIWLLFTLYATIYTLVEAMKYSDFYPGLIIPPFLFIMGYILMMYGYEDESVYGSSFIAEAIDGEVIKEE